MRTAILCFFSAMLGAAVILVVSDRAPLFPQAQAQVQSRRPAARPVSAPPAVPSGPILDEPDLDRFARADEINAEELTAEEVVNVAVYENGEIFVKHANPSIDVLRHEYRHAQQHRTWGVLFYPAYLFCHLVFGYDGNPFEVDAVAYERRRRG